VRLPPPPHSCTAPPPPPHSCSAPYWFPELKSDITTKQFLLKRKKHYTLQHIQCTHFSRVLCPHSLSHSLMAQQVFNDNSHAIIWVHLIFWCNLQPTIYGTHNQNHLNSRNPYRMICRLNFHKVNAEYRKHVLLR
jgi:hypothetical protein